MSLSNSRTAGTRSLVACLGAALIVVGVDARAADFQAGFAVADITPPVGWRRGGGFSEVISTGVHDPLFAKALVLSQGEVTVVLVGNDLMSVPRDLATRAREKASAGTGVPAANIVITATHSHGGPEYYGPLRDALHKRALQEHGGRDPHETIDYQSLLVDRWVGAIEKAYAARRPVDLSVVVPQQEGLAFNRRYLMKDGSTGWNPGRRNPQIFRPLGPVDTDLPFVLARDAATGRPMGSLTVFAMHTAIYGGAPFGACYPGYLQSELRRRLDAPDFVSLFGEGCAGDVNHIDVSSADPQDGESYPPLVGAKLASTIAEALPLARPVAPGMLAMKSVSILSPVSPISETEYADARGRLEALDRVRDPFLVTVDAWRKVFRGQFWTQYQGREPQEVQAIRLDRDTAIVTLPHEVFVELGMAIKSASPFRTTIVVSLANDLDFYIPTRRAFEEGNYEPTTCPLDPGCGERLVSAAVGLLNELKP